MCIRDSDEDDFYEAIASFSGASKRLEKIAANDNSVAYKDFAHSPSKVSATTKAVKNQYPNRKLIACLELHTYSSLNAEFLKQYNGALKLADEAIVFYSPEAVAIKKLDFVSEVHIKEAFNQQNIRIFTDGEAFREFLYDQQFANKTLLLMSSGNYGGLNFETVKELF